MLSKSITESAQANATIYFLNQRLYTKMSAVSAVYGVNVIHLFDNKLFIRVIKKTQKLHTYTVVVLHCLAIRFVYFRNQFLVFFLHNSTLKITLFNFCHILILPFVEWQRCLPKITIKYAVVVCVKMERCDHCLVAVLIICYVLWPKLM